MVYLFFVVVLTFLVVAWFGTSWVIRRDRSSLSDHDELPMTLSLPVTLCALRVPIDAQLEEIGLVEHLLAGSLPPEQYRHRMAALAVRDAHRNPVFVPPDGHD